MSKPLKPKRGTTAQNDAYIGEAYEVTLDTDKHTLRVHDGVTAGGHELANGAALQELTENINTNVGTIREDTVAAAQLAASMSQGESGSLTLEGVAAEVGIKANASLDNLSAAGKSLAARLGMPSGRFDVLTFGASGTTYTAPANGYVNAKINGGTSTYVRIANSSLVTQINSATGNSIIFLPVKAGSVFRVEYGGTGIASQELQFHYAEGDK